MVIRRPTYAELKSVACAAHLLHAMENGNALSVGATPQRAFDYLYAMLTSGRGTVFVAIDDNSFCGCVAMQFDVVERANAIYVGNLYVEPSAPRKTVLHLMEAVMKEAEARRAETLWLLGGTSKNKTRRTYFRLGFAPVRTTEEGAVLFCAPLRVAAARMRQMLGERKVCNGVIS